MELGQDHSVAKGGMVVKKSKAFTLIELLVVVAIIALLISILLPSLSRARELSKRTVCLANLRGVGQAFYIYAQDDPGTFPCIAAATGQPPSSATEGQFRMFYSADRTMAPPTTGIPSPTVDMWTVVRSNNTTPKQFICPSTTDQPDPAQDTTVYYDFYGSGNLSYAYQYQHDPNCRVLGTTSDPSFPVLADANPYLKGGVGRTLSDDRVSPERGNSVNHTNREGQNMLFQDSHANFEKAPDVGLSGKFKTSSTPYGPRGRDNVYTTHLVNAEVDWGNNKPTYSGSSGTCNLGDKSDACLIP